MVSRRAGIEHLERAQGEEGPIRSGYDFQMFELRLFGVIRHIYLERLNSPVTFSLESAKSRLRSKPQLTGEQTARTCDMA
jgi:hypothetical protein